ncbi:MAG TPA: glutamine synthetase family protein [Acetobacteraceae bacterium]|nr:glutamine synthetase family protein [Acetobacteraceae bacterium]
MLREELVFVGTCDIAGHVRGKGFPARALEARRLKGVGWTHSNLMQTAFGPILDTPFGTGGDLMIVPDPEAEVRVDFNDGSAIEHFFLGDICNTDGSPWECCPRAFLRRAISAVATAGGLSVIAAFEQEFVFTGNEDRPGDAYALGAFRRQGIFGESFVAALREAGVQPDTFLAEYGARQFEVTVAPAPALRAADRAVITREMARAAAHRLGHRAVFSPMPRPEGVGNGVHIHLSLWDAEGRPVTHDPAGPLGLGAAAAHFAAGVLHHLPAIAAITAPSPVSYLRLTPNRWAPTAVDMVRQDRGAALRVCPVFAAADAAEAARQFNMEFRVCDAAASPYLALGAVLFAGADGLARSLHLPAAGSAAPSLPRSLPEALDRMAASGAVREWFGPMFLEAYLRHKRSEVAHVAGLDPIELCERYFEIY